MSRIRSIYPGQWTDEDFVVLSPFARLLALAIRNEADDNGVFEWKPLQIKMRLFPADMVDVAMLLAELAEHRHISSYQVCGRLYGIIRNFGRWQNPRRATALYPLPERSNVPEEFLMVEQPTATNKPGSDLRQEILDLDETAETEGAAAPENGFPTSADIVRPYLVVGNGSTPLSPPETGERRIRRSRLRGYTAAAPQDSPSYAALGSDYGPSGARGISWGKAVEDFFEAVAQGRRPFWGPFWPGAPPDQPGCYAPAEVIVEARQRWLGQAA